MCKNDYETKREDGGFVAIFARKRWTKRRRIARKPWSGGELIGYLNGERRGERQLQTRGKENLAKAMREVERKGGQRSAAEYNEREVQGLIGFTTGLEPSDDNPAKFCRSRRLGRHSLAGVPAEGVEDRGPKLCRPPGRETADGQPDDDSQRGNYRGRQPEHR